MAQNVTIAGNSYPDVPAVNIPKTGGGLATFYDASGIDYAGSPTSGGNANVTNAILYGTVDSTSTSTVYTATVAGLEELVDGTCIMLHNGVVTSASGFTVNINGLGAKKCYNNMTNATQDTTIFNVAYTMMFVYSSALDEGNGGWWIYRGYDGNTNTIGYQVRTNSGNKTASDTGYRYRIWLTSADGSQWVPINTSTSTNGTSNRTLNTRAIDPFGPIVYRATNGTCTSGTGLGATGIWQQYTLTIGYSYMASGFSLAFPDSVYLRCTPNADGSATMNDIVQALPSTKDGKIYIYLGTAYSATAMELEINHPVYWHDGTGIRAWTGAEPSGGGSVKTTWYGTCDTTASTAVKVVSCSDFVLTEGAIIGVFFSASAGNTATTPTLNVNSTGAKSIYIGANTPNSTTNVLRWSGSTMIYFMYDGTGYRYMHSVSSGIIPPSRGAATWYISSTTAANVAAKVAAGTSNFVLTQGSVVGVRFSNANTVSDALTLNVNSTGAKSIYYRGEATSASNPLLWDRMSFITFLYSDSSWYVVAIDNPLPTVTSSDNGKVLQVVNGAWAAASLPSASGVSF